MSKKDRDPIDVEIGSRIRDFRENIAHDTREDFVAKTTLSLQFVYDIEAGNKGLSAKSLRKIVAAYRESHGLTSDYLLFSDIGKESKSLSLIAQKQVEIHLMGALSILKNEESMDK